MLYINTGVDDAFALVSTSPAATTGIGSLMADFTGDGLLDLLTTQGSALALIVNTGDTLSFIDTTAGVGLDSITIPSGGICVPAAADFDLDGNLEIAIVGSYGDATPSPLSLAKFNIGTGKYENVAAEVLDDTTHKFEAWNPTWVDIDNDGYIDLFLPSIRVSFPTNRSGLYFNYNGEGLDWSEINIDGLDTDVSAIASVWGDIDNDGDMDLIAQAFDAPAPFYLLLNNGDGTFTDVAAGSGIAANNQMRGLSLGDYDNDGDQDLLIGGNGMDLTIYQNQLIGGSFTFTDVTSSTVGTGMGGHRSALFVDYNSDGLLDVFTSYTSNVKLLKNDLSNSNNWIGFRLSMTEGNNKSAIGARVRVAAGDLSIIRDIQAGGYGGLTGGNLVAHFGLGFASEADSVIINWPDGSSKKILGLAANQYYDVDNSEGGVEETQDLPEAFTLTQNYLNPLTPKTTVSYEIARESHVRIGVYDLLGREVVSLVNGVKKPGIHTVELNAANLSSGVYFCRIKTDDFKASQKFLLTK
ncbi:VCBS repeat-containing protein [candidate division WOR-3 bacterium]|nr:VCBS repeat-containing protein [candidate division WOR-3 bacterium]